MQSFRGNVVSSINNINLEREEFKRETKMTIFAQMHKQEQFKGSEFPRAIVSFDREIMDSAKGEIKGF